MRIALLQAHHIPPHRQEASGGNYPHVFANLFDRIEVVIDIEAFDVTRGQYPPDDARFDAYLISGSSASAFDPDPWIQTLKQAICRLYEQGKTLIGICFGHQIIAEALGGQVVRAEKGWGIGVKTIEIIAPRPWMDPYYQYCSLLFYHQDHVIVPPPEATILARNEFCEVQMFCIGDQVLGIQAHPEMLSGHNHRIILDARGELDDYIVKSAVESLRIRDQGLVVGRWIAHFIGLERSYGEHYAAI